MIGTSLGHYEILEPLGAGGMGEVYRATDTTLKRDVAIKVLPEDLACDPDRLARLEREAHLLASLNHPNIATIHSLEEADGTRFVVMELVKGESLDERLSRGQLSIDEALDLCRQIAEAFQAAHAEGIIHRDLKPANVLVTPDGRAKVLDFGLAKTVEPVARERDLSHLPTMTIAGTQTGVILGTVPYMSPEQVRGKPLDKRADIWAFGCVLYETLSGKRAFDREAAADTLAAIIEAEPDWRALPAATPAMVGALLRRCLRKDPNRRLHDIADARIEIEEALSGPADDVPADAKQRPSARWHQAVPWVLAIAMGAMALFSALRPGSVPESVYQMVVPATLLSESGQMLALSPDGTRLAYVGGGDGGERLFLRSLDSFDADPIAGTEGARSPFFSPDGNWIGFHADGQLKVISAQGGPTRVLSEVQDITGASWSGNEIAFTTGPRASDPRAAPAQLFLISADSGEPRPVDIDLGARGYFVDAPQLLPGERAVLFTIRNPTYGSPRVDVKSLDTGAQRMLIENARGARFSSGHLVYAQDERLLAAPFDATTFALGPPTPLVGGVYGELPQFSLSGQGTLAYIPVPPGAESEAWYTLLWVDRDATEEPVRSFSEWVGAPRVSPDGSQIAIWRVGLDPPQTWIHDLVSGVPRPLDYDGASSWPVWHPDGTRIAFISGTAGGIFSSSFDGRDDVRKLTGMLGNPAMWSDDGERLLFDVQDPDTGYDIWVLDAQTEQADPFLQSRHDEIHPALSPDGQWLAYASNESGRFEISVIPFPAGGRAVTLSNVGGVEPMWSPDGQELFFRALDGATMMVLDMGAVPQTTLAPTTLFTVESRLYWPGRNYDVAHDGQRFLILREERRAMPEQINVWVNWPQEIERLSGGGE